MTLTSLSWDPHPHPSPGSEDSIEASARGFSPSPNYAVDVSLCPDAEALFSLGPGQ